MTIQNVSSLSSWLYPSTINNGASNQTPASSLTAPSSSAALPSSTASASTQGPSVEQQFLDYMKETPEQRRIEAWLKAHGLTQSDLAKMSPAQQDSIKKEMADQIKIETQQKLQTQSSLSVNIQV